MGDGSALGEKTIIARIREQLRAPLAGAPLAATPPPPQIAPDTTARGIEVELGTIREASDISDAPLRSYRRMVGPFFVLAQRIARKLLSAPLQQQVSYNLANHRLLLALRARLESLEAEQQTLQQRCKALQGQLEEMRTSVRAP